MSKKKLVPYRNKKGAKRALIYADQTLEGDCIGILKFSIIKELNEYTNFNDDPGFVFEISNRYFNQFPVGSIFSIKETLDLKAFYVFLLIGFRNDVAILEIIAIDKNQNDTEWIEDNEIKIGRDFGIIEYWGDGDRLDCNQLDLH